MIRPLDESLIDFEKSYRQIFKEPLHQHQQYTKRQLIYNYAAVGSLFLNEIVEKKLSSLENNNKSNSSQSSQSSQPQEVDIQQLIKQWNDSDVKIQDIIQSNTNQNNQQSEINQQIQRISSISSMEFDQDQRNFKKDIEVLKKQKLVVKTRLERNLNFRKELQLLFKTRNISMLSVQSMRSHFNQLKPLISFNSKNRGGMRRDRQYENRNFQRSNGQDYNQRRSSQKGYQNQSYQSKSYYPIKNQYYSQSNQITSQYSNNESSRKIGQSNSSYNQNLQENYGGKRMSYPQSSSYQQGGSNSYYQQYESKYDTKYEAKYEPNAQSSSSQYNFPIPSNNRNSNDSYNNSKTY